MSSRRILDRTITPEWMSLALGFARSEDDPKEARQLLNLSLRDEIESKGGRGKTVTVLTRSWLIPDPDASLVVEFAVKHAAGDLRPWHLGVMFANYPFFADACAAIGRQLALGDSVSTTDLRVSLKRRWGDRPVIDVGAWSVVRTLRAFDVLKPTDDESNSELGRPIPLDDDVYPWLIDALLVARGEMEIDMQTIAGAPEFFMFELPARISRDYPNLETFTEGGGRVVVQRKVIGSMPTPTAKQLKMDVE